MTRSTGINGLIFLGSPPSRPIALRIAARSTTAGTPVKSCNTTREGVNAISVTGFAVLLILSLLYFIRVQKVKNEKLNFKFTGQQDEQQKEMDFLSKALLIAVFLILIIVVTQFNSFSTPTIIMMAVGFSLIGVLLGIISFGDDFIIIAGVI